MHIRAYIPVLRVSVGSTQGFPWALAQMPADPTQVWQLLPVWLRWDPGGLGVGELRREHQGQKGAPQDSPKLMPVTGLLWRGRQSLSKTQQEAKKMPLGDFQSGLLSAGWKCLGPRSAGLQVSCWSDLGSWVRIDAMKVCHPQSETKSPGKLSRLSATWGFCLIFLSKVGLLEGKN